MILYPNSLLDLRRTKTNMHVNIMEVLWSIALDSHCTNIHSIIWSLTNLNKNIIEVLWYYHINKFVDMTELFMRRE
jgi:hypothetical protein